jgi:hypothetical protein
MLIATLVVLALLAIADWATGHERRKDIVRLGAFAIVVLILIYIAWFISVMTSESY